jgi:4-amino-4-deoxy-L-arabinose transferase-like glycosyltransferase
MHDRPSVRPESLTGDTAAARRLFLAMFWGTLALKIALATLFPLTGDEAFFIQWGKAPAWGYADHPPMIGWWLALLLPLGDALVWLRSATVLVTSVIALGLVSLARRALPAEREASAWWAGAVYLAMPWSWLFVLVTTDTPLVFFLALSMGSFLRAELAHRAARWYALAGLCVGLAFLSKYFAALLGLAYAVYLLGWRRERAWALPWMFLFAFPFIAGHLVFNATHGWVNVMFNLFNRHEQAHWQWRTPLVYLGMAAYLFTPWLVWAARRRDAPAPALERVLLPLWLFPMLVFAVFSLKRTVGLHWVLGFTPLFVLWCALRLSPGRLKRAWRWTLGLSLLHLLGLALLMGSPLSWWQSNRLYQQVVFLREAEAVTRALERDLPDGSALMADGYSQAAVLSYHHGRFVSVYGVGRHYARQDDLQTDFREWEGRRVRVFSFSPQAAADHAAWFEQVSVRPVQVDGATFYVIEGEGFKFLPYRERVLSEIARHYHRIPAWLPLWGNPFCERYGFADCSPGR